MIGYNGLDNLVWFLGVIEDVRDPTKLGRIKIRAFGFHPTVDEELVPKEDLPWAYVIKSVGGIESTPKVSEFCFGCFLDGRDAQQPLVLGTIPIQKYAAPTVLDQPDTRATDADPAKPKPKSAGDIPEGPPPGGSPEDCARQTLPDGTEIWGASRQPSPEQLAMVHAAADQAGVPREIFTQLVAAESGYRGDIWNYSSVSSAGARGPAQLMPGTARELGVDINDPQQNLNGGANYLKRMYNYTGSWRGAVQAYNAGPGNYNKWINKQGRAEIPFKETQAYHRRILGCDPSKDPS
jgi:hypothetical protein